MIFKMLLFVTPVEGMRQELHSNRTCLKLQ